MKKLIIEWWKIDHVGLILECLAIFCLIILLASVFTSCQKEEPLKKDTGNMKELSIESILPVVNSVSVDFAHSDFKSNQQQIVDGNKDPIHVENLHAYSINLEELSAMVRLIRDYPEKIQSFKIYFAEKRYVVGLDKDGAELYESVYLASPDNSEPCPPSCDEQSKITQ